MPTGLSFVHPMNPVSLHVIAACTSALVCVLQRADAADRKTEKKKLTEIKGTRRDREAKLWYKTKEYIEGYSKLYAERKLKAHATA